MNLGALAGYEGLIAPIIEAIKELDDRLRALEQALGGEEEPEAAG